ncbi:MAG TPA: GNAT family N-acetyltransferase [Ktedonobacteraceae bacterium]|jgi:GNAT superfamily N-acetyltransferase
MQLERNQFTLGDQAGFLWTWWKGDPLPPLPPLSDFAAEEATDIPTLATLMECAPAEVTKLLQKGHRPYLARLGTVPVAVGWSAIGEAEFGGGRVFFHVPPLNRYLYYFITRPEWRGQGMYPRLLQYILTHESAENERFWIVHQRENIASQRGIARAGFRVASKVYFLNNGKLAFLPPPEEIERARAASTLFGLPLLENK